MGGKLYIGIRIAARRVYGGNGSIGRSSEAPLYLQYKLSPIARLPSYDMSYFLLSPNINLSQFQPYHW